MVLDLEEKVAAVVKKLTESGLVSPVLAFIRRGPHQPVAMDQGRHPALEDVLKTMHERVAKFDVEKIKPQDLAGAAVARRRDIGEKTAMTTS